MIEVDLNKCGIAWNNFSRQIYQKYDKVSSICQMNDIQTALSEFNGQIVTQLRMDGTSISGIKFNTEEDYLFFCLKWS